MSFLSDGMLLNYQVEEGVTNRDGIRCKFVFGCHRYSRPPPCEVIKNLSSQLVLMLSIDAEIKQLKKTQIDLAGLVKLDRYGYRMPKYMFYTIGYKRLDFYRP